ncbi:probable serine hydrolase [Penaeus chinensis]|uniref:probable serine hydrolase n=1 Tax=Penaeus chinensis TaxID=139456 RepID=UPI001FB6C8CA|nr:probable serine hydrolase [Penaeus chinensis]XP_047496285.1 probable serine hydrolase [Penaeus chinensis]XP_047496286.1 probable serine hydrolase [Penaeus chinensis]
MSILKCFLRSCTGYSHYWQAQAKQMEFYTYRSYTSTVNDDGSNEVKIEVPWGVIAGKEWGPKSGKPVLAVHGWQDNAGSFDRLVPLLNSDLRILAIDLPGHGKSSPFPPGIFFHYMDYLLSMNRVVRHMEWDKFIYLGHSLGSILGYIYCSTFPETVEKYIGIEALKPKVFPAEKLQKINRKNAETFFKIEGMKANTQPVYSYEEAVRRMLKGYDGSINEQSCEVLLRRGLRATGNGYTYSRDPRVKVGRLDLGYSEESLMAYASNMSCEVLNIKAKNGLDYEPKEIYYGAVEALKKTAPRVQFEEVEGTHHLHLNTPENIASLINEFISS